MAAVNAQVGRISRLGGRKEDTPLTYQAPNHEIRAESTDLNDDPKIVEFESENGTRDPIDDTREGIHKVDFKFTTAMRPLQGAWLWVPALGPDTLTNATPLPLTQVGDTLASATSITFSAMPALPAGVASWVGYTLNVEVGGTHPESKTILAVAGAVVTVAAFTYAHAASGAVCNIGATGTPLALTLSGAVTAGDTTLSFTTFPALPAGIAEWVGNWIQIDTGGTHPETKLILGATGTTALVIRVSPMGFNHTTGALNNIPVQHVVQPGLSTYLDFLDPVSFCGQYGTLYEKQLAGCVASKVGLKGDAKTIALNWEFSGQVVPVTSSVNSFNAAAGELTDKPFILRDGGLLTPFAPGDSVPATMHNRILTLDYELNNTLVAREYGGGQQYAEQYVVGDRSQMIKWTEDAGQNSANPDIYTNYVSGQAYMQAYFAFINPTTGMAIGMWFPKCEVRKYKDVKTPKGVIGYDGELVPLSDKAGSGKSCKLSILNNYFLPY